MPRRRQRDSLPSPWPALRETVSFDEWDGFCRDRLAPHKIPKIWIRAETLPMTGSGKMKIMKHVLREQLSRGRLRP